MKYEMRYFPKYVYIPFILKLAQLIHIFFLTPTQYYYDIPLFVSLSLAIYLPLSPVARIRIYLLRTKIMKKIGGNSSLLAVCLSDKCDITSYLDDIQRFSNDDTNFTKTSKW